MTTITIEEGYRVTLPLLLCAELHVGDVLLARRDEFGRIILVTKSEMEQALDEAFGIWANRTDIPADGVEYVNQIRGGTRFDEIRARLHETA